MFSVVVVATTVAGLVVVALGVVATGVVLAVPGVVGVAVFVVLGVVAVVEVAVVPAPVPGVVEAVVAQASGAFAEATAETVTPPDPLPERRYWWVVPAATRSTYCEADPSYITVSSRVR